MAVFKKQVDNLRTNHRVRRLWGASAGNDKGSAMHGSAWCGGKQAQPTVALDSDRLPT